MEDSLIIVPSRVLAGSAVGGRSPWSVADHRGRWLTAVAGG